MRSNGVVLIRGVVAALAVLAAGAFGVFAGPAPTVAPAAFRAEIEAVHAEIDTGRYTVAEQRIRPVVERGGWHAGHPSPDDLAAVDLLVESLWRQGKIQPATRTMAEQVLEWHERLEGPDARGTSDALKNLANLVLQLGEVEHAESLFVRTIRIRERLYGPDAFDVLLPTAEYGGLLQSTGRTTEARRVFLNVMAGDTRLFGAVSRQVAWAWNNIAYLDQLQGNYLLAIREFQTVLTIREQTQRPDHPDIAHTLNCLANLHEAVGDYERARDEAQRALEIRERNYDAHNPEIAKSLGTLASLLRETGDYAAARAMSERALAIREQAFGPDHTEVATALLNLAEVRLRMGDFAAVRPLLERALAIRTRAFGPRGGETAIVLDRLSDVALAQGDARAARAHAAAALAARRSALGNDHPSVAQSLVRLAAADLTEGATDSARAEYSAALDVYRATVGPRAPETGRCLRLLGEVEERMGDLPAARRDVEAALAIADSALGEQHPEVAACWLAVARVRARSGDADGALDAALRGEAIGREHLRTTIRSLPEREALRYASIRTGGLDFAVHLAARSDRREDAARALDAIIRSRSLVLDEMALRQHALAATTDPGVRREEQQLQHDRDQLTHLRLRRLDAGLPREYVRLVDSLQSQCEQRERALAERSAPVRQERARGHTGLAEVAAALPAGSALISYLYCNVPNRAPEYVAFVLRAGEPGAVRVVALGPAAPVDSLVRRLRRNLRRATELDQVRLEPEYRDVGARLRRLVWDPLERAAGRRRLLLIVPDGALDLVSIRTLPIEKSSYLVEREGAFQRLASERDVVEDAERHYGGEGLLAFGAPAFDSLQAEARSARRRGAARLPDRFGALPGTEQEVREVATLWNASLPPGSRPAAGAMLMTGAAASPQRFLELAPGRRVLHCATHGYALDAPRATGVDPTGVAAFAASVNPLDLSGLALAGANHWRKRPGCGLLTSSAIATLDLGGTEWVVLSSCGSGVGALMSNEGVLGMQRAFQAAGAGTVITSLWEIDDLSTRRWMRALYTARLQKRMSTAEATRAASIELLHQLRAQGASTHPYGWGAFVAVGDWR